MSKATTTPNMLSSRGFTFARTFNPDTFTVDWDLFLSTDYGIVQLSRFDGVIDYEQGGLGEGKFFEWDFVLHEELSTPGDGTGSGRVHLEQEYGSKLKFKPEQVVSKLNGEWFDPVLQQDDKEVLAKLSELNLPPETLRESDAAVLDSDVDENRMVLDSVYGPISLNYYDGLVSHVTGEMLPISVRPYVSDNYQLLVDVESDSPGLVETYTPQEVLYLLETRQFSCYIDADAVGGQRVHLLADGREVGEPVNAVSW